MYLVQTLKNVSLMQKILAIVVTIEIDVDGTVPFWLQRTDNALIKLSHGLIVIWQSQEMVVHSYTWIFHGFNSFLRILWRIKCNVFIHWKSVLYYVNFEVINMDLFGTIHAINWINSSPCWINTCGGFHITVQVGVFSFFI